ncbi:MAG: hypothetical protein ACI4NA_07445 [Succinivibrio sp.]
MKVVNATWDEESLGVRTAEVSIGQGDSLEEIGSALRKAEASYRYLAVKLPSTRADACFLLSDLGYTFVEDMIFLEHDLHEIRRTPLEQRFYDSVKVERMQEEDFRKLLSEIDAGSFSFDRVSIDPYFSKEASARRFHHWLMDEKGRGAILMKASYKGEMSGFFTIRDTGDGVYSSALGGTFMKFRHTGIGINNQTPEIVKRLGGRKLVIGVSTNNMSQIRAVVRSGFFPIRANHVYIKHTDIAK